MDKSTSRQTVKLLLGVLGVVLFAVCYFSIRPKLVEKTEKLTTESVKLAGQLAQLTDLEANEAFYSKNTKEYEKRVKNILDKYPANVLEEDVILYAPELIGRKEDMRISVIGFVEATRLFGLRDQANGAPADAAAAAGGDLGILEYDNAVCPNYEIFSVGALYDFVAGYEDIKSVIAQILSDPDKRNVPTINLTYEKETGLLVGNIGVNLFYITGTDKVYHEPSAGSIPKGNDNFFGTIETRESEEETETE